MKISAVILAAGQGTRMRSTLPKVLHPVLGKPMASYSIKAASQATGSRPVLVVGHGADAVRQALGDTARLCRPGAAVGNRSCRTAGGNSAAWEDRPGARYHCRYASPDRRDAFVSDRGAERTFGSDHFADDPLPTMHAALGVSSVQKRELYRRSWRKARLHRNSLKSTN